MNKIKARISGKCDTKLQVVKYVKEFSGLGLKEAKALCNYAWDTATPMVIEIDKNLKKTTYVALIIMKHLLNEIAGKANNFYCGDMNDCRTTLEEIHGLVRKGLKKRTNFQ